MHACLVKITLYVLKDTGILDMPVVTEACGLRASNMNRFGNALALDFFANDRHLLLDAIVTSVYRNNNALSRVATTPGHAAKHVEDRKF